MFVLVQKFLVDEPGMFVVGQIVVVVDHEKNLASFKLVKRVFVAGIISFVVGWKGL